MAAVTALFRDIAGAVEENEAFLRDNFGTASVVEVVMGLQVVLRARQLILRCCKSATSAVCRP